jgi:hypothetical protein
MCRSHRASGSLCERRRLREREPRRSHGVDEGHPRREGDTWPFVYRRAAYKELTGLVSSCRAGGQHHQSGTRHDRTS